jgi:predicted MFS family arabinose efflux permease
MSFAFMIAVIAAPMLLLFLDIRKRPPIAAEGATRIDLPGYSLGQALRSWRFWLLAVCFVPISYSLGAIIPSLVPLLTSKGYPVHEAVALATLVGLAGVCGRLFGGLMIDRFWAPGVAFVFLAAPALALHLLMGDVSHNVATIAILMIGFGAGVEYDFMAYIVSRYFGMKRYSAIYGAIYGFFAVGAGFGPTVMNNLADAHGWDKTLFWAGSLLVMFTAPLLLLGRYRKFEASGKAGAH